MQSKTSLAMLVLIIASIICTAGCVDGNIPQNETGQGSNAEVTNPPTPPQTSECELDSDCPEDYKCKDGECTIKYYSVTPPFQENFDNPENRKYFLGSVFTQNITWEFKDGVAKSQAGGFLSRKVNAKNYVIEVDFKNAGDGGILIRGDGDTLDYYGSPQGMVFIYRPVIRSYGIKQKDGDSYWISYSPALQGSWGWDENSHTTISGTQGDAHLKIVVQDNTFTAYANGQKMATFVDTEGTYSGEEDTWIALYYNTYGIEGQAFDNLEITPA